MSTEQYTREAGHRSALERVLMRHWFVTADMYSEQGFCAGPYCALGLMSPREHVSHLAEMVLASEGRVTT